MKKINIVGAGIGGLVSAIYLAKNGNEVTIFEKNHRAGGKIDEYKKDGFRFDLGPQTLTMPEILIEFFNDTGENIEDHLELIHLEKSCRYFWSDGTVFNSYSDKKKLFNEIDEVFGKKEKENFKAFLKYSELFYDLSREGFLKSEFKLRDYLTKKGILNFTKFISGKSINDLSNKFFKNKKLKQLINYSSLYNGSSPFLTPQLFSIIPYVEYEFGSYYIKGGISQLITTLVNVCEKYGVEIITGYELTDINYDKKKITELHFNVENDQVKSVKDFDELVLNFTNNEKLIYEKYLDNIDWSSSGFILLIGLNKKTDILDQHNIFFSDDYEKEFIEIFEKKIPSKEMTIYLSISSKKTKDDAPEGCENLYVFVNAPSLSDRFEWNEKNKIEYKESVIDKIESFLYSIGIKFREHIEFCRIISPVELRDKYNSEYGAIYGLSSNSLYAMMKRPPNRSKKFSNLYFAGGNTMPGGGVPLSFLSGKAVSKMISKN
jgi:phytoene desaturase